MINLNKKDSVAEAVKSVMKNEADLDETGLRKAAYAAHSSGQKMFTFKGKTYPVKVQGENITYGESIGEEKDCVTEPEAKKIAKKEVGGHVKKMHHEEIDPKVRTKDMIRGRKPTAQKDDVGPGSDGKSTKVKYRGGPMATSESKMTLKKFKEEYEEYSIYDQMIQEVLSKDASAGDWIHDFVHSDNPKFKGKSKEMRKKMALAAYYAKQRNEEVESDICPDCMQDPCVCAGNHVEESVEQIDELSKSTLGSYVKSAARDVGASRKLSADFQNQADKARKPSAKAAASRISDKFKVTALKRHVGIGKAVERLTKEDTEQVEENAFDWKKPKPPESKGGAGVKAGRAYGGAAQKSKPEHDEPEDKKKVNESKRPETDNVPFEGPYNPSSKADVVDKSGAHHTPMSRVKHLARQAMKRVKKEMLGKAGGTSE